MLASFETLSSAFVLALCIGAALTAVLCRFAARLRLLDAPGGRKDHSHPVPMVGGIAIFVALLAAGSAFGAWERDTYLLPALALVVAVGLWDDAATVSPRLKLVIQVFASALMIAGAGVVLRSVGDLVGWRPIGMSVLAVPMSIFALVGVVNALNMIDGLDGLCGSVALIAFAWYAAAAAQGGLTGPLLVAVILCGAIAGFLVFNLRLPWQREARAFLGDAGSLTLGFALGWLAIDLTQRGGGALYPISALWILLLPLADCVSLMTRRLQRGSNPFVADREHIHHYLLARGLTHQQTVATLVAISAAFGAVGYFGWRLAIPEPWLFWPFCVGYFTYHAWIKAAWKRLRSIEPAQEKRGALEDRPARALG